MIIKAKKGFTLIEILIALLIFSTIMGGIYSALMVGNRSWLYFLDNVTVQREARESLYFMVHELREARNILITKDDDGVAIRFKKPGIGVIAYIWTKKGENAHKLIRENNADKRILARNISALAFAYPTNNAVTVDITASKAPIIGGVINLSLKGKAALRSKIGLLIN